jgi:putative ABC transport system permease protein
LYGAHVTPGKFEFFGMPALYGRGDVLGSVIKTGLRLVGVGVVIGLMASLALSRVLETQLWSVSAYDPVTLGSAVMLLLATGVLACWIPARRASRVEPLVALRYG